MQEPHYSFVVDSHGPFAYQGYLLAKSLIEFGEVRPDQITANLVDGTASVIKNSFKRLGLNVAGIKPFPEHRYCNKIQQLQNLHQLTNDAVVLLDTDTFVTNPLIFRDLNTVSGKIVDYPNPPFSILKEIFEAAALTLKTVPSDLSPELTAQGNFNGGLYLIPTEIVQELHVAWEKWAKWCLSRISMFESWSVHVDQVSFALAVADLNLPTITLPRRYNHPTHHGQLAADEQPWMIHYHRQMDNQLFLLPTGDPATDKVIEIANAAIYKWRKEEFPNALFWSARYALDPELGSGVGSRGNYLKTKRDLIKSLITQLSATSVIDIGGGDGAVMAGLADRISHTAVDIAPGARIPYLERNPLASFSVGDISQDSFSQNADLAICLDLLIHLDNKAAYLSAVENAIEAGSTATLIAGFDDKPVIESSLTFFHEPLIETLEKIDGKVIFPLLAYRGLGAYLVLSAPRQPHARDIRQQTLRRAIPLSHDPKTLLECVATSRRAFSFFPDHIPRCIEYPWVLGKLRGLKQSGLLIADIGAGINVLPLLLSNDGHKLLTVDAHTQTRHLEQRATWNEWRFFDYSQLDRGIRSIQNPYESLSLNDKQDVIYSVSVIEHLQGVTRRAWIAKMAEQIKTGGRLLLTVDLVPMSRDLWPYSEGQLVEPIQIHGTLDDLLDEIRSNGFQIDDHEVFDWIPGSRVSIALISAQRQSG
jgi:2-polyprenyl-3-methyl-5-hydroxy-6-metoxy-1,4-benzoquinol methylase